MDKEDTGVSGSGIDVDVDVAKVAFDEDKDCTGSGEIKDGDWGACEGLALKSSGRVRDRVDLRTAVIPSLF